MSYRALAAVYDTPRALEFALASARLTRDLAERLGIAPGRLLDIGCGTGTFALEMAGAGWDVTGLDLSPPMIARASGKAGALGDRAPRFLEGDVRDLGLRGPFDLVTSFGAVFNHLPAAGDLQAVLERVRGVLAADGAFVFDAATSARYGETWHQQVDVDDTPDAFIATRRGFDPATGRARAAATIFLREDDRYLRLDDEVEEFYYSVETIAEALKAAGFDNVVRETGPAGESLDLWTARTTGEHPRPRPAL